MSKDYSPLTLNIEYYLYGWIMWDEEDRPRLRRAIHDYVFRNIVDESIPNFKDQCDRAIEEFIKISS